MNRFALFCALIMVDDDCGGWDRGAGPHHGCNRRLTIMGPFGRSPITGSLTTCEYCHAPHSARPDQTPLWSQKLSTVTNYTLYSNPSMVNQVQEPPLGSASNLCLSCHDGTVAPGQTSPYGAIKMSGSMNSQDVFGTNLGGCASFQFQAALAKRAQFASESGFGRSDRQSRSEVDKRQRAVHQLSRTARSVD